MTERNGKGVGGIGRLGYLAHAQKRAHHSLHLLLGGVPVTRDGNLYFSRRVAAHRDTLLRSGQQDYAANLGKPQCRFHVEGGEHRFEGDAVRPEFLDQFSEHGVNFAKAFGKMFGAFTRGAQGSEAQHATAPAIAFDHAIPGGAGRGGINAQHADQIVFCSRRKRHGNECTAEVRAGPDFFRGMCSTGTVAGALFAIAVEWRLRNTDTKSDRRQCLLLLLRGHHGLHFLFVDIEVGGNFLNVIVVFERFDEPEHLCRLIA